MSWPTSSARAGASTSPRRTRSPRSSTTARRPPSRACATTTGTRPSRWSSPTEGSYADPTAHVEQPVEYDWQHHLGEIVSSLARAGLRIEFLHGFPFAAWQMHPFMVEVEPHTWRLPAPFDGRLPLTFSLAATKT